MKLYLIKLTSLSLLLCIISHNGICYADNSKLLDYKHPLFEHFSKKTLPKLNDFSSTYLSRFSDHKSVLYPFGGADIIYPLLLFPNATTYTLIGLEKIGKKVENIPEINKKILNKQLDSLLRRSFFITEKMNKDISDEYGLLQMFVGQLNTLNCKINKFEYSDLDFGKLMKITFNYLGTEKNLIYLKSDLQNKYLKDSFFKYIEKNNLLDLCILKAGSYCLHRLEFSQIRDFLLNHASVILQDDTGIPIDKLSKNFNIELFGNYITPYGKEWVGYYQKSLVNMYNSNKSIGKISFCYGYGCGRVVPAIILAVKK